MTVGELRMRIALFPDETLLLANSTPVRDMKFRSADEGGMRDLMAEFGQEPLPTLDFKTL